jgi:predicted nucleic acid-binding protein
VTATEGFLLDTNIISAWFGEKKAGHDEVLQHVAAAAKTESPLLISAVTFGEITYGHLAESPRGPTEIQKQFSGFVLHEFPAEFYRLPITHHTAERYGAIRAEIFRRYSPAGGRKVRRLHQLDLPDDVEKYGQQIQENDIWLASQAIERNVVFVSHDKMAVIVECAKVCGLELRKQDWCEPMVS